MEQPFELLIRAGEADDVEFVLDSWRRSYDTSPWTRCPAGLQEYIATQRQVILQCLKTSDLVVGCDRNDPSELVGWVCHRGLVIHYVYVKPSSRNKQERVGSTLLLAAFQSAGVRVDQGQLPARIFTTHGTRRLDGGGIDALVAHAARARIRIEYNPALIFGGPS